MKVIGKVSLSSLIFYISSRICFINPSLFSKCDLYAPSLCLVKELTSLHSDLRQIFTDLNSRIFFLTTLAWKNVSGT